MLWKLTADSGILFLMETPAIQDLIVNSTALAFILNIDELLFATITTEKTRYMLSNLEGFEIKNMDVGSHRNSWCQWLQDQLAKIPMRLFVVTGMWFCVITD